MKFSVTIPAYKAYYLREAIESVVSQTFTDWELIVVDDCSPENLHDIVAPFLNDQRIHYYRNKQNCGAVNVVDNWNICLSHCKGDYVICMGDDDRLLPCCLKEYEQLIRRYPQVEVLHAWTEIIDEDGRLVAIQQPRTEWESALSLIWNRWNSRKYQFIGDFCFNTQALKAAGGYYKLPLAWGSDDITAVRAARQHGIANTQSFCFQYRENRFSITSATHARLKLQATISLRQWFRQYFDSIDPATLSHADANYLHTMMKVSSNHFRNIGQNCTDDLRGNPLKLPYWYRQLKPFGISGKQLAKWYLASFAKAF